MKFLIDDPFLPYVWTRPDVEGLRPPDGRPAMSATSCTCIRDATLVRLVPDPTCPAWQLHARFPLEHPAVPGR